MIFQITKYYGILRNYYNFLTGVMSTHRTALHFFIVSLHS